MDGSNEWDTFFGIPVTGETSSDIDDNLRTSGSNSAIGHFDPTTGQGERFTMRQTHKDN